jgi:hypothetical protein
MSISSLVPHMAYDVFISHKSEYKGWVVGAEPASSWLQRLS